MEDGLELPQQLERVFDTCDILEVTVDIDLQLGLDLANVGLELNKVTVEDVVHEVEQFVRLLLELPGKGLEGGDDGLDILKVVLLKGLELLDSAEQLDQFANTARKQVKFAKDLGGVEVKLLGLGHVLKALLGEVVLLDVGLVQIKAGLEHRDQFFWGVDCRIP